MLTLTILFELEVDDLTDLSSMFKGTGPQIVVSFHADIYDRGAFLDVPDAATPALFSLPVCATLSCVFHHLNSDSDQINGQRDM